MRRAEGAAPRAEEASAPRRFSQGLGAAPLQPLREPQPQTREVLAAVQESHSDLVAKIATLEELVRSEALQARSEVLERVASVEQSLRSPPSRHAPCRAGGSPPPLPAAGKPRSPANLHPGAGALRGPDPPLEAADAVALGGVQRAKDFDPHAVESGSGSSSEYSFAVKSRELSMEHQTAPPVSVAFAGAAGLWPVTSLEYACAPDKAPAAAAGGDFVAPPRTSLRGVLAKVEKHPALEVISALVSIGNAIALGLQTDAALRDKMAQHASYAGRPTPSRVDSVPFVATSLFFALWVFAELWMRCLVHADSMLKGWQVKYIVLDVVVVLSALAEVAAYHSGLSAVRVLQLLRLVRVARSVLGVQKLRGVRRMLSAAARSVSSLIWAVGLLFLLIWVAAMLLLQSITMHYQDFDQTRVSPISLSTTTTDTEVFELLFGSVAKATRTLFAAITGGINWMEAAEPLMNLNPLYSWFFLLYVSLLAFGALNVISAFFVDQALQAARRDHWKGMRDQLEALLPALRDAEGHPPEGGLSAEALEDALQSPALQEALQSGGVSKSEAVSLHRLMCAGGGGAVSPEEFASGCVQLRGGSASALALLCEGRRGAVRMEALGREQREHAESTAGAIRRVESMFAALSKPQKEALRAGRSGSSPRTPTSVRSAMSSARSGPPKCDRAHDAAPCAQFLGKVAGLSHAAYLDDYARPRAEHCCVHRALRPVSVMAGGPAVEAAAAGQRVVPKLEMHLVPQGAKPWPPHMSGTTLAGSESEAGSSTCEPPPPPPIALHANDPTASLIGHPRPSPAGGEALGRVAALQRGAANKIAQRSWARPGPPWTPLNKTPSVVER